MNKFRNKKIFTKDGKFDSKREMHRYLELVALQEAGEIAGLERRHYRASCIIYSRFPLLRQRGKDCCRGRKIPTHKKKSGIYHQKKVDA